MRYCHEVLPLRKFHIWFHIWNRNFIYEMFQFHISFTYHFIYKVRCEIFVRVEPPKIFFWSFHARASLMKCYWDMTLLHIMPWISFYYLMVTIIIGNYNQTVFWSSCLKEKITISTRSTFFVFYQFLDRFFRHISQKMDSIAFLFTRMRAHGNGDFCRRSNAQRPLP